MATKRCCLSDHERPAPPVPADCDLTDFRFMPLDCVRLRDSGLASEQTPEENWAAVLLWIAAWHQVPSSSMPDSDNWIAKAAGYMSRGRVDARWKEVRDGAMRHFVLCSDGRWYHPVVAEKANEAWLSKLRQRWKTECGRIKKHNERHKTALRYPDFEMWLSQGCPLGHPLPVPDDTGSLSQGHATVVPSDTTGTGARQTSDIGSNRREGTGKGQGREEKGYSNPNTNPVATASRAAKPTRPKAESATGETWRRYAAAFRERYRVDPVRNATVNGQLSNLVARLGQEEAPAVAEFFVRSNNAWHVKQGHSIGCLLNQAEKIRTEWATGRTVTDAQAQQIDRTQTNANAFAPLIAEARARENAERNDDGEAVCSAA